MQNIILVISQCKCERKQMLMQKKIIYSLRIYMSLKEKGFEPIMIMPNPKKQEYTCWVYKITPEFQKALDELMEV